MIYQTVIRRQAELEFEQSIEWYEERKRGLGIDFELQVHVTLKQIASRPDQFPIVINTIREAPVSQFPFCIYYRIRADQIVVVAIFHQSRDPSELARR